MTDNILKSRTVVTAKVEGTYGSDPTPANTDAIEVENLQISRPSEMNDRGILKSTIGKLNPILGRKYAVLTFSTEIKGSGAAGTAPDADVLLEACATLGVNSVGVSETYSPVSTSFKSCTIWVYRDGKILEFNGCRGNCVIDLQVGKIGKYNWTFWGKEVDPIDGAIVSPSVDSTDPVVLVSASFSMGSYASVISKLMLDFGNVLAITDDANDASGYGQVVIVDRDAKGSFDPQDVLIATHDFWSDWEDGTQQALTIALTGSAGNITTITAPKCVVREYNEGDRNGIMVLEHPFTCAENSGDDEFVIAYT